LESTGASRSNSSAMARVPPTFIINRLDIEHILISLVRLARGYGDPTAAALYVLVAYPNSHKCRE
jgi:hypothetical protein